MPAAPPDFAGIDAVLLDMDGTVLDLAFDNWFWRTHVPERYARRHGIAIAQAHARLHPEFRRWQGHLQWYCLDHWSDITGLDLRRIHHEARARIRLLPTSRPFIDWVRGSGRALWLVTNAHPATLEIKLEVTGIAALFDRIVCSHDYGAPKEDQRFWQALAADRGPDPARSLMVDDSLPVLRAAREHGIAHQVFIRRPDSTAAPRTVDEFHAVDSLAQLIPAA